MGGAPGTGHPSRRFFRCPESLGSALSGRLLEFLFRIRRTRTWHTAAATSSDGIAWTKLGRVLSPQASEGSYIAANGSALVVGDEILYWYEIGYPLRIALARSRDGKNWTRHGEPVVPLGPRGSFDERAVADPYVIRAGGNFYMFYLGQDRARRQSLGIARSTDGVAWEKLRTNPILEPGGARSVRRKRPGRARRMDLRRPMVDAVHRPR